METSPENQARSGAVRIPDKVSSGGIDAMLAPRSQEQQASFTAKMDAKKYGYPVDIHERNERIRNRVPVIGGWIADKLHSRMKASVALKHADDTETLLR